MENSLTDFEKKSAASLFQTSKSIFLKCDGCENYCSY